MKGIGMVASVKVVYPDFTTFDRVYSGTCLDAEVDMVLGERDRNGCLKRAEYTVCTNTSWTLAGGANTTGTAFWFNDWNGTTGTSGGTNDTQICGTSIVPLGTRMKTIKRRGWRDSMVVSDDSDSTSSSSKAHRGLSICH